MQEIITQIVVSNKLHDTPAIRLAKSWGLNLIVVRCIIDTYGSANQEEYQNTSTHSIWRNQEEASKVIRTGDIFRYADSYRQRRTDCKA